MRLCLLTLAWRKYCQNIRARFHKCPNVRALLAIASTLLIYSETKWSRAFSTGILISTFYQASLEFSDNRTHIPSGGGYGDARLLQGLLRSASISLPWLIVPLPPEARGSTLHIGPGLSQCNMSGMWNIPRPWVVFCGHVCGRSLLSIRTSCGTGRRTRHSLETSILKVKTFKLKYYDIVKQKQTFIYFTVPKQ